MNTLSPAVDEYTPVPDWARLPDGISFRGSATSVAVDAMNRVYVYNRGTHPIVIFDPDGNVLEARSGGGEFDRPHSIRIVGEHMWLVDVDGHTIEKRSLGGDVIMRLGTRGRPCEWQSGGMFNMPTDLAVHPITGDFFIADGYGNSRIHRFSPEGEHILSWGEPGTALGQFALPHSLVVTADDRVVVCDRENYRIQVFSVDGHAIEQWHLHRPFCIATSGSDDDPLFYVGENRSPVANRKGVPGLGSCVQILDTKGVGIGRFGAPLPGHQPDQFMSPHGIAVDSLGDVYVAEVSNAWIRDYGEPDTELVSLRKWTRHRENEDLR